MNSKTNFENAVIEMCRSIFNKIDNSVMSEDRFLSKCESIVIGKVNETINSEIKKILLSGYEEHLSSLVTNKSDNVDQQLNEYLESEIEIEDDLTLVESDLDDESLVDQNNDESSVYSNFNISPLYDILVLRVDDEEINLICDELRTKGMGRPLLLKIFQIYNKYYNNPGDIITDKLEEYLIQLEEFNIKITHAIPNVSADNFSSFEVVKKTYLYDKLNSIEKTKLSNIDLEDDEHSDGTILLELCPKILLGKEEIYPGKILVS